MIWSVQMNNMMIGLAAGVAVAAGAALVNRAGKRARQAQREFERTELARWEDETGALGPPRLPTPEAVAEGDMRAATP